jgi:hypothetical protein
MVLFPEQISTYLFREKIASGRPDLISPADHRHHGPHRRGQEAGPLKAIVGAGEIEARALEVLARGPA